MASRGWENVTLADIGMRAFPKQGRKAAGKAKAARSKYRAVRTVVNGWTFDSKAEALRYADLLYRGIGGLIRNLELQPRFPIVLNGLAIATYIADFRYEERDPKWFPTDTACAWRDVVEDVKGFKTPIYRLKKKLVAAQYGIQIREVK